MDGNGMFSKAEFETWILSKDAAKQAKHMDNAGINWSGSNEDEDEPEYGYEFEDYYDEYEEYEENENHIDWNGQAMNVTDYHGRHHGQAVNITLNLNFD